MSLKPIDFQVILQGTHEVGKKEKEKLDKKKHDQDSKDRSLAVKTKDQSDAVVHIDKAEVGKDVPRHQNVSRISGKKHNQDNDGESTGQNSQIIEKFKGNFLDITE